jgi:hypothetical protein
MAYSTRALAQTGKTLLCLFLLSLNYCCMAAEQLEDASPSRRRAIAQSVIEEPTDLMQLHTVTRLLVLKAIEFNRFIIHYRLENDKQPKLRLWRYFLAEEILAACNLSYDTMLIDQLGPHLSTSTPVSASRLRSALTTSLVGTTVGASGSVIEVGSNIIRGFKNRERGFDVKTAGHYFVRLLHEFDDLLAEREYLVEQHRTDSSYPALVLETNIYCGLRIFYLYEFFQFHENTAAFRNYETVFYVLNATGDILEASAALVGLRTVNRGQISTSSNVLYTIGGAFIIVAPMLSSAVGSLVKKHTHRSLIRRLGPLPPLNTNVFQDNVVKLTALNSAASSSDRITTVPVTLELAEFTESGRHFQALLEQETVKLKSLSKVAVQTNTLGPAIGATVMTEGILGTVSTPKVPSNTGANSLAFSFAGAVCGLAGAATSTVANVGILGAHTCYSKRLRKEHRLPEQLALQRLEILDRIEEEAEVLP